MKNRMKIIGIKRETFFNGKRRVGIDTNILIKLYDNPFLFSYEEARIFSYQDIIFTHVICKWELIKYLKEKKELDENQAKLEASNFIRNHHINIIYSKECFVPSQEIENFEQQANRKFKEIGRDDLKCHKPDSIILLAFQKMQINKVFSTDEAVRECAQMLGIDGSGIPSLNHAISRELRKLFDYKRKHKKRRH